MNPVVISTPRKPLSLLHATNQTTAAFSTRTPVASASLPTTGLAALQVAGLIGGKLGSVLKIVPFGYAAAAPAGKTVKLLVIGWQPVAGQDLWVPQCLAEITATLGGATASVGGETVNFAESIALTASVGLEGSSSVATIKQQSTNCEHACALLDINDYHSIEVQVIKDTADKANALTALL